MTAISRIQKDESKSNEYDFHQSTKDLIGLPFIPVTMHLLKHDFNFKPFYKIIIIIIKNIILNYISYKSITSLKQSLQISRQTNLSSFTVLF